MKESTVLIAAAAPSLSRYIISLQKSHPSRRRIVLLAIACSIVITSRLDVEGSDLSYCDQIFMSTHNSYEGGSVGSIVRQLDAGVRQLELDIHGDDIERWGDYRLGHDEGPGERVAIGNGNPNTDSFTSWLRLIGNWSNSHSGHSPITIVLDLKSSLSKKRSYGEGNLTFLNAKLKSVLGEKLYSTEEFRGTWPSVEALRNRFIVVLSGDVDSRREYLWDTGRNPAVASNSSGNVVEVHDSGYGTLWYWSGKRSPDGFVRWMRHGCYDTGQKPAVAINNNGVVVEVHESGTPVSPRLFYQVGKINQDYDITWFSRYDGHQYDNGITPTVRFLSGGVLAVHEIHCSENESQNWSWEGFIDVNAHTIAWKNNHKTVQPLYPKDSVTFGNFNIQVSVAANGASSGDTLLYRSPVIGTHRIRYEQVAFVESQKDHRDDALWKDGVSFCATPSSQSNLEWALARRRERRLVRLWDFNERLPEFGADLSRVVNFPATDSPFAPWYKSIWGVTSKTTRPHL
jgi:hypothetical protein